MAKGVIFRFLSAEAREIYWYFESVSRHILQVFKHRKKWQACSSPSQPSQESSGLRYRMRRVHSFSLPLVITQCENRSWSGCSACRALGKRRIYILYLGSAGTRDVVIRKKQRERVGCPLTWSQRDGLLFFGGGGGRSCKTRVNLARPNIPKQLRLNAKQQMGRWIGETVDWWPLVSWHAFGCGTVMKVLVSSKFLEQIWSSIWSKCSKWKTTTHRTSFLINGVD